MSSRGACRPPAIHAATRAARSDGSDASNAQRTGPPLTCPALPVHGRRQSGDGDRPRRGRRRACGSPVIICAPDGLVTVKSHRDGAPARAAVAAAVAGFAVTLAGWLAGGGSVDLPWAPTLDLRLDLALDGLGALYALLATGIGAVVFAYGAAYLPLHLEHQSRPASEGRRFWPWMTLFMVSMVGLACARDLILLFVFFDLTGRVVLPDRVRPRAARGARRGAHGAAGHGGERGGSPAW